MSQQASTAEAVTSNGAGDALLEVEDLEVYFPVTAGLIFQRRVADVKAVDGVTFNVKRGETLGLVGESGCGKSTTGKTLLKLLEPDGGSILFDGSDITGFDRKRMAPVRRDLQVIFQDPYSSINPRATGLRGGARHLRVSRSCSSTSGSARSTCADIRTSSPVASASGSRSPAPCP